MIIHLERVTHDTDKPVTLYTVLYFKTSPNATLFVVIVNRTNHWTVFFVSLFTVQPTMKTVQTCRHFWKLWEDRTKPKQDRQPQVSVINFLLFLTILQSYLMRQVMRRQDQIIASSLNSIISVLNYFSVSSHNPTNFIVPETRVSPPFPSLSLPSLALLFFS